jgi:Na+/H+ antiporter NhaC
MILQFLARSNQLSPRDILYFCIFAGLVTVILYIMYITFMKDKIEE